MIRRIRLDLDDVLNTLMRDVLAWDGIELGPYENWIPWTYGYDIIGATAALKGGKRMSVAEYWSRLPRSLWANFNTSPEFSDIIEFCDQKVGLENVLITTSPTKCPECLAGKYNWIERHLPRQLQRQYSITPRKWEYGYDVESVLIDDLSSNCDQYRARGGHAIVVPRPWNQYHLCDVMDIIQQQWDNLL